MENTSSQAQAGFRWLVTCSFYRVSSSFIQVTAATRRFCPSTVGIGHNCAIRVVLWMDEFLHHFEKPRGTIVCLVFTRESSIQGFVSGAKWISYLAFGSIQARTKRARIREVEDRELLASSVEGHPVVQVQEAISRNFASKSAKYPPSN